MMLHTQTHGAVFLFGSTHTGTHTLTQAPTVIGHGHFPPAAQTQPTPPLPRTHACPLQTSTVSLGNHSYTPPLLPSHASCTPHSWE